MKYIFLAVSLFVCSPSWADETYPEHLWYIGGGLGAADSGMHKYPASLETYSAFDKSGQAGKLFFGKHITKNIDVEVFYANLGRSFEAGTGGWYATVKSNSYGVAAKYFPFEGAFRPYAKFGLHMLTSKDSGANSDGEFGDSAKSKSTNILYGVGADYAVNKNVRVALEYEVYGKVGSTDPDLFTETIQLNPKVFYLSVVYSY
jgi:OOP family OmpA-OmpF porin